MFHAKKCVLLGIAHFIGVTVIFKISSFVVPYCVEYWFSNLVYLILCLVVSKYTFDFTKKKFLCQKLQPHGKAVLITGCDSGFGHLLAKRLDSRGFIVFASCLFPSGPDADDLREHCSEKLKVLGLNVVNDDSVKEAFQFVKENLGSSKLWAIVNNAGIQKGFTTDFASLMDFKDTMEVNCFGMVRVTKTFLPLLKQLRGRVINLTSLHGRIPAPHNTPYVMSKYAASGFSDCLRMEMDVWGIRVIQVEPEIFQTRITDLSEVEKRLDSEAEFADPETRADFGENYFQKRKIAFGYCLSRFSSSKLYKVVDDLETAITSEYPDVVYNPSRNRFIRIAALVYQLLPYKLQDFIVKILFFYVISFPTPSKA